ncbi:hypothetical protein D3C77_589980 [compost metagenome]
MRLAMRIHGNSALAELSAAPNSSGDPMVCKYVNNTPKVISEPIVVSAAPVVTKWLNKVLAVDPIRSVVSTVGEIDIAMVALRVIFW